MGWYTYNGITHLCLDCMEERGDDYTPSTNDVLRMWVCDGCKHVTQVHRVYQPYKRVKKLVYEE